MSVNLTNVLQKKFEKEVIQAFQDAGTGLRTAVRTVDCKGANQYQFQVIGATTTAERTAIHTPIPLIDASHTPKVATVKNYVVSDMTDIFLNNQISFDERQALAASFAMSLERRLDQVILDSLAAATITKTVASGADNLNVAQLAEAARLLGSDVPDMDRHMLCHDDGFYHFIQETEVASSDFNMNKALAEGRLPQYLGFDIHKMGDRAEGGLPLSGSDRTNYAWQKNSVGLALNMAPRIEINYEPSYGAHRVTGFLSAGAVVIQEPGVVEITTAE